MEKLLELSALVKCSIHVEFNAHKGFYESAYTYYADRDLLNAEQIAAIDFEKDIWSLQFYPRTPISFYYMVGNDLESMLDQAVELMKKETSSERR